MKLENFETLAEAQAYAATTDTKQVGSGQARGLFVSEKGAGDYSEIDIWRVFSMASSDVNNPLFSLANAIIITASDSGSYFGMDEDKADGVANRAGIASLVAMGVMTQTTADKFIGKTISTTYPFKHSTQEEFDEAKLLVDSEGSTESVVKYDAIDSIQAFHVRTNTTKTQIEIMLDAAAAYDTKFRVFVSKPSGLSGAYVEQPNAIYTSALIKAGETETVVILEQFYNKHTKYRIVSDRVDASTALVTSVSKY